MEISETRSHTNYIIRHPKSGTHTIVAYKHRERKVFVNFDDPKIEYPHEEVQVISECKK